MRDGLRFSCLKPADVLAIQLQPSQRVALGMDGRASEEEAEIMAASPIAWSAWDQERLLACFGITERFDGVDGVAWALLAGEIGAAHLELTRFMRGQVEACDLFRIELMARAPSMEGVLALHPGLDPGQIVALAMKIATPEMRWACLLGFKPAHLLRCFGAACESVMLFERINPPAFAGLLEEAA